MNTDVKQFIDSHFPQYEKKYERYKIAYNGRVVILSKAILEKVDMKTLMRIIDK